MQAGYQSVVKGGFEVGWTSLLPGAARYGGGGEGGKQRKEKKQANTNFKLSRLCFFVVILVRLVGRVLSQRWMVEIGRAHV